jgi:hypothetical protein
VLVAAVVVVGGRDRRGHRRDQIGRAEGAGGTDENREEENPGS